MREHMKKQISILAKTHQNNTRRILLSIALSTLLLGCSTLNIESARELGTAGQQISGGAITNIFASEEEYQRAIDAEQLLHGYAGTDIDSILLKNYDEIQFELASRKEVFQKLGEAYAEFEKLASIDSATGVEAGINGLGDAINQYASARGKGIVVSQSAQGAIGRIGGLIAAEIQKEKLKKSSTLIRGRLTEFHALLMEPIVKTQLTSFKKNLAQSRGSAIDILLINDIYDPTPLLTEIGSDAGLQANRDALKIANKNADNLKNGIRKVILSRLQKKADLVERAYDASISTLSQLIERHKNLENGEKINLSILRQKVNELVLLTDALAPHKEGK